MICYIWLLFFNFFFLTTSFQIYMKKYNLLLFVRKILKKPPIKREEERGSRVTRSINKLSSHVRSGKSVKESSWSQHELIPYTISCSLKIICYSHGSDFYFLGVNNNELNIFPSYLPHTVSNNRITNFEP